MAMRGPIPFIHPEAVTSDSAPPQQRRESSSCNTTKAVRRAAVGVWAVAFLVTVGLGGAFAGTRLISHFENDNNADP
jgi:ribosomal protein L37AE/L43A